MRDFAPGLRRVAIIALLLVAGCCHSDRDLIDPVVRELAALPVDVAPPVPVEPESPQPETPRGRLQLPRELPGVGGTDVPLPGPLAGDRAEREKAIQKNFPELTALSPEAPLQPGPEGRPLTLSDLQRMALTSNPVVRQAVARVEAARGTAIQAGLAPNPVVGYEGDTMATAGLAGYQGGFVEQTIKTAGKLQLAQAAAKMDVAAAELSLRSARNEVITRVRKAYFDVLWARESLRIRRAVVNMADEMHRLEIDLLKAGQAASYEVIEFRVLATQARVNVVDAQNRALSTWKQLVAVVGCPELPPSEVEGKLDRPVPLFDQVRVLAHILEKHTNILTAYTEQQKARYSLRLAQVKPVPDVDLRVMLQKDYTSQTYLLSPSIMVGVPVPVWDRNQGGIKEAEAELVRVGEEATRQQIQLREQAAGAFANYLTGRQIVELYRDQILPDLVRVYRGIHHRYQTEPEKVNFNDVAVAQQNLVNAINSYLSGLSTLWSGTIEIAGLLQTDDLYGIGSTGCLNPTPLTDLEALLHAPAPAAQP